MTFVGTVVDNIRFVVADNDSPSSSVDPPRDCGVPSTAKFLKPNSHVATLIHLFLTIYN